MLRRFLTLFRGSRLDRDLDDEIQAHLDLLAERYRRRGMSDLEAAQAARRDFGGVQQTREQYRDQRGIPIVESTWRDAVYAVRSLSRNRSVAAMAVLSLALGIGANTAIFSIVHAMLLNPMQLPDPDRLVLIWERGSRRNSLVSALNLRDWQSQNDVFEDISAFAGQSVAIGGGDRPERIRGGFVSPSFFRMLRVSPARGVDLANGKPGARDTVIAHSLWSRRFNNDPSAIGKSIALNGETYTVVGILPSGFRFPLDGIEAWLPLENYATSSALDRSFRVFMALGRLKPGVTQEQAGAAMRVVSGRLAKQYSKENAGFTAEVESFHEFLTGGSRQTLLILMGAVGLLLLTACANTANLLAARATRRQREMAVRAALGAGRLRLIRQLLLEGLVLSCAGGAVGVLLAALGVRVLPRMAPEGIALSDVQMNGPVLLFSIVLAFTVGLAASLLPALSASRVSLHLAFQDAGRSSAGLRTSRWRDALIVLEVAVALLLVTGSGLLLRSLYRLLQADKGFSDDRVLTMEYRLHRARYRTSEQQWEAHRRIVEEAGQVPGVISAALARAVPFSGNGGTIQFIPPGGASLRDGETPVALLNTVTADFFRTLSIPVHHGRTCDASDRTGGPLVALVNDRLAARLWPDGNALGQMLEMKDWGTATVIGITGANRQTSLRGEPVWQIYACYSQNPGTLAAVLVRTEGEPAAVAELVKRAVWKVDAEQPVWKVRTMERMVEIQTASDRLMAAMLALFATLALLLSVVGVYGVVSYSVVQRTREIGIRMALGAARRSVLAIVLRRVLLLSLLGIAIGLGGAIALGGTLSALLYQVRPADPATLAACAGGMALIAIAAAAIPARRAATVSALDALRYE